MLFDQTTNPMASFIFAHGAGAGQDSEFMHQFTQLLVRLQINVIRFDFPYMQKARETGKRRPPDRAPVLMEYFVRMTEQLYAQSAGIPLFIGGKSMGGRMASLILERSPAVAGICLGYPFHPIGKPDKLRTEHLQQMSKPLLIAQGERDTFGNRQEIANYSLSDKVRVMYLDDGDHSFKPRKSSGLDHQHNIRKAAQLTAAFIQELQ